MKASRPAVGVVAVLCCAACFPAPPPPRPAPKPAGFDIAALRLDGPGLVAAAERLCATLTGTAQKDLGFALAQEARKKNPKDKAAALTLARCAGLRAERQTDPALLGEIAEAGINAAKAAGAPDADPRAAYWLAVNLGLAMQQRGVSALALMPDEIAALKAAQAVPDLEVGGPLRALGMLYLRAPPWPAGPGDLDTALELLRQAAERYPSHPLNRLFYGEALAKSGEAAAAAREWDEARALARPELWGDDAALWLGWIDAAASR